MVQTQIHGLRQSPGSDWIRRAHSRLRGHTCARGGHAVIHIKMEKFEIIPAQVTAHVGDTVEWVNADLVARTATARDGAWDVLIPVNAARSVVLKTAGQLDYRQIRPHRRRVGEARVDGDASGARFERGICKFHPNMTGQISVSK